MKKISRVLQVDMLGKVIRNVLFNIIDDGLGYCIRIGQRETFWRNSIQMDDQLKQKSLYLFIPIWIASAVFLIHPVIDVSDSIALLLVQLDQLIVGFGFVFEN